VETCLSLTERCGSSLATKLAVTVLAGAGAEGTVLRKTALEGAKGVVAELAAIPTSTCTLLELVASRGSGVMHSHCCAMNGQFPKRL
jgi:hypothetical protein